MEANTTLLIWFVGLTGFAVLLQACVLLGILLALRKTAQAVNEVTKDVKTTVIPLVHTTRELLERVSPQIQTVSTGLADLTDLIHKETAGTRISVSEVVQRANVQIKRVDGMVTVALDAIEKTAAALEHSVAAPVRQVNGVVAALKAIIGTYRATPRPSSGFNGRQSHSVPDPDSDIVL
jgi:methyl-accepting chemotaxis protein